MDDPAEERAAAAQHAWERVQRWSTEQPADGRRALSALEDIAALRRRLDATELDAVRAARSDAQSWAEIALAVGISRQSAWERWREVDQPAGDQPDKAAIVGRAAARLTRSRGLVAVPSLVGSGWDTAHERLGRVGLVASGSDPDGLPITAGGWPNGWVIRQYPDPDTRVPRGSTVRLWLDRGHGGSAGVREPRTPRPTLRAAAAEADRPLDEVG